MVLDARIIAIMPILATESDILRQGDVEWIICEIDSSQFVREIGIGHEINDPAVGARLVAR